MLMLRNLIDTLIYRKNKGKVPIFFFDRIINVGDVLNPYLISKIVSKAVFLTKHRQKPHILGIGSIMHFGGKNSRVWGSGIIKPDSIPKRRVLKKMQFFAVRGEKTKRVLEDNGLSLKNIPLGDPAVLMDWFYTPKKSIKRHRVGIVPHFVDFESDVLSQFRYSSDVLLIDVKQQPETFLDQLSSCDYVLSSSLHGLILSDTYGIPNLWVTFSNKIIGGNFKFLDYYSTTSSNISAALDISNEQALLNVIASIENLCSIKPYKYDKQTLLNAFPFDYV